MDALLTRAEAAQLLRKPVSWLRYCERRKLIPFHRIGQQIRYAQADLQAWIASRRVPTVQAATADRCPQSAERDLPTMQDRRRGP
jgi:excisionase family DNA binding protein